MHAVRTIQFHVIACVIIPKGNILDQVATMIKEPFILGYTQI